LTLTNDKAFPHRNLILFITFVVILFTLVLQGLSLKPLIRVLKIQGDEKESEAMQALDMRLQLANAVLAHMDGKYTSEMETNETYKRVRERYERMISITQKKLEARESTDDGVSFLPHYRQMLLELIEVRRRELNHFRQNNAFPEELIREREWELDLEEARLRR
jgi:CPA1 family monovalent cation:H+ antiporter